MHIGIKALLPLLAAAILLASPSAASAADLDCSDFATQEEAQENLLPGDPHGLDGDGDGVACESLPSGGPTGGGARGGSGGRAAAPPPPPPRLDKAAARRAAERKARKYGRRSSRVGGVDLRGCGRVSRHRVDCRFLARGRNGARITSCRLRVVVRGKGRAARAKIANSRCRSRLIMLTYGRARGALQTTADRIAGKRVTELTLRRLGFSLFVGLGEWTRPSAGGEPEDCLVEMTIEQKPSGALQRIIRERLCV
jgi:Excalibur calcium-binding domain